MSLDLISITPAMKQYYNDAMYEELVYKANPLLALIPKDEKFVGINMPIPLKISDGGGVSADFAIAQSQASAGSPAFRAFLLTRVVIHSVAAVDGTAVEAAVESAGAFIDALTASSDSVYNNLARTVALQLYRSGFGDLGQVSAEPGVAASVVIILKNKLDATNFGVGQSVQLFAALTGGSAKTREGATSVLVVEAVDASAGTITLAGAYDASGDIAANDYLFLQGTRGSTSAISGLAGWIPTAAPTSALWFGVDRTVDATKLGGVRHDGSGQSIEEALIDGAHELGRVGGMPDFAFVSFKQYAKLVKTLTSKEQYVDVKVGAIGFRALEIIGSRGSLKVIADMNLTADVAYLITMKSWKLVTVGKAIGPVEQDGMLWLRQPNADGLECRFAFRGNLACNAPGHNAVVQLPAL